jgi:hypothetical protein
MEWYLNIARNQNQGQIITKHKKVTVNISSAFCQVTSLKYVTNSMKPIRS